MIFHVNTYINICINTSMFLLEQVCTMYACKCVKLGYSVNLHSEKPLYCKSEV